MGNTHAAGVQASNLSDDELQRIANGTGATVDLFLVPGVGHTSLFPGGTVSNASRAIPVLNHSYAWLSEHMGVQLL